MRRERDFPLTNLHNHIRTAFPRHPIKHLARGLGCSDRQAWRIATTGRAPGKFRSALIRILESAYAKNGAEIERLQRELKAIDDAAFDTKSEGNRTAHH